MDTKNEQSVGQTRENGQSQGVAAVAAGSALSGLENCPLHRRTPFGITNVSMTQFSIARYSMGCTFNGDQYLYVPQTDELIRSDVLKWKNKHEKAKPNGADQRRGCAKTT